jgi:hypothetical protein
MTKPQFTIILFLVPSYSLIYSGMHVSTLEVIRILPDSAGGGVLEAWYNPTFLAHIRSLFIADRTLDLLSSFGFLWLLRHYPFFRARYLPS